MSFSATATQGFFRLNLGLDVSLFKKKIKKNPRIPFACKAAVRSRAIPISMLSAEDFLRFQL
jgi:hypothetical protein